MKNLNSKGRQRELNAIAAIADDQLDLSDIPELTEEQLRRAVRGRMYRPVKKPVTMRLDADIIEWLKQQGPGYQTKANALLRREMIRFYRERKEPPRDAESGRGTSSKKIRNVRERRATQLRD
jgi:uncharacterized protein (DUF4415 family)